MSSAGCIKARTRDKRWLDETYKCCEKCKSTLSKEEIMTIELLIQLNIAMAEKKAKEKISLLLKKDKSVKDELQQFKKKENELKEGIKARISSEDFAKYERECPSESYLYKIIDEGVPYDKRPPEYPIDLNYAFLLRSNTEFYWIETAVKLGLMYPIE
jgi:hypothetical protein